MLSMYQSHFQWSSCNKSLKVWIMMNTSPLGKKSSPTTFSNNELFPALYIPNTHILGSEM